MPPAFVPKQPLPRRKCYDADAQRRAFWRLSYRVPPEYLQGKDALGRPVLVQHEREKNESYTRRQQTTKARNHVGPLVRKYNDFVFRRPPTTPETSDATFALLLDDADGHGTGLVELLRRGLKRAQVEREVYYLPDTTKPADAGEMTVAQATAAKVRPIVRTIGADAVYWWRDEDGVMVEALVLLRDDKGDEFARLYDADTTTDVAIEKDAASKWVVVSVGDAKPHDYGVCPLVRHRPMFDDAVDDADEDASPGESQVGPLAELQQDSANKQSLLDSELYDCTFSQWIASGVDANRVKDVEVGNTRIICLPDPASKFDSIGADPTQAASLSTAIDDTVRELHRIAGVSSDDPLKGPAAVESGVAKAFKFNDLAANLAALADSCECAANALVERVYAPTGAEPPGDIQFADDFDSPDFGGELLTVVQAMTVSQLPKAIKQAAVLRFAARNLSLDSKQQTELVAEVDAIADESRSLLPAPTPAGSAGT